MRKPVLIKDMSIGPQACSEQCRQESIRITCLERYGCETAVISDHARELSKQTCMRKYGVDHYSKTDEYHEKFKKTSIERFGVDVPMKIQKFSRKLNIQIMKDMVEIVLCVQRTLRLKLLKQ